MKNKSLALLLGILGFVAAAGVSYLVADSRAQVAERELEEVTERAWSELRAAPPVEVAPGTFITSMIPPTIPAATRARIDALQFRLELLAHRRDLAGSLFFWGIVASGAVAALMVLAPAWRNSRLTGRGSSAV
jgi:hypothetical protein